MTAIDRASQLIFSEAQSCPRGLGSTYCRMIFLVQSITGWPNRDVHEVVSKMFPVETEEFARETWLDTIYTGPLGRKPGDNAEWN
jgi:hypothetical protein